LRHPLNRHGAASPAVPVESKESIMKTRSAAAIAVAVIGALGTGLAQAHTDVQWSVSIGLPFLPIYAQPAPVYVQPAPVYAQPVPVYVQPAPVYVQAAPVIVSGPAVVYGRPLVVYRRAPPVYEYRHPARWDRDGDGIANRYDRHPGNPWRP
jgi:hypothetical protein